MVRFWEKNGYFHQEPDKSKKPFSIVMPPPNVTGQLHMGHALDNTLQDILVRFKRMEGYNVAWIPGTDHAGIATQVKVEQQLAEEGKNRYEIGREEFLKRVWAWKEQYGSRIEKQIRRLGSSCDWSRKRFTMTIPALVPSGKSLFPYMKKASSIRVSALPTGALIATRRCRTSKSTIPTLPAICGLSNTPSSVKTITS